MNELSNTVSSNGTYNNIPTSLTSNTSVVNIIDGLTLTKTADKQNWGSGSLTYTITIDNQSDMAYENPTVTDVINTNLVKFLDGSVVINNTVATSQQYNYDDSSHTLTVTLDKVAAKSTTTITFRVDKNP